MKRKEEIAVLGGGCFWRLGTVYADLQGVLNVESGYAGYCRAVVAPKVAKFRQKYAHRLKG